MSEIVQNGGAADGLPEIIDGKPPEKKRKPSRKQLIIAGVGAAVLAIGGGSAGYMFLSGGSHDAETQGTAQSGHDTPAVSYVDVPPMMINLRTPDGAPHMLKLRFMLVPAAGTNAEALKKKLPAILDAYQPFLRELRPEDLGGSAAVFRIKEEMLMRANMAAGAGSVSDILIQDLVQQ